MSLCLLLHLVLEVPTLTHSFVHLIQTLFLHFPNPSPPPPSKICPLQRTPTALKHQCHQSATTRPRHRSEPWELRRPRRPVPIRGVCARVRFLALLPGDHLTFPSALQAEAQAPSHELFPIFKNRQELKFYMRFAKLSNSLQDKNPSVSQIQSVSSQFILLVSPFRERLLPIWTRWLGL